MSRKTIIQLAALSSLLVACTITHDKSGWGFACGPHQNETSVFKRTYQCRTPKEPTPGCLQGCSGGDEGDECRCDCACEGTCTSH